MMQLSDNQKNLLFKAFLFCMIEVICFSIFVTVSGIYGNFEWTVEELTSSPVGMFIQILNLVIVIDGILIFLYLLALIITFIKG